MTFLQVTPTFDGRDTHKFYLDGRRISRDFWERECTLLNTTKTVRKNGAWYFYWEM
jgi:hypothetical protein